jgi:hypothetical protein
MANTRFLGWGFWTTALWTLRAGRKMCAPAKHGVSTKKFFDYLVNKEHYAVFKQLYNASNP